MVSYKKSMENFIFGFQSVLKSTLDTLSQVIEYKLFWGFIIGFIVSTVMHSILIIDNPKHIPLILLQDKSSSFQKIHKMQGDQYNQSFHVFCQAADKIKFSFGVTIFLLLIFFFVYILLV